MNDVFVGIGVPGLVSDIPAEGDEEIVDELHPELGFLVGAGSIVLPVPVVGIDQIFEPVGG